MIVKVYANLKYPIYQSEASLKDQEADAADDLTEADLMDWLNAEAAYLAWQAHWHARENNSTPLLKEIAEAQDLNDAREN